MENKQLEVKEQGIESQQLLEQITLTLGAFHNFVRNGECIVETYEQLVGTLAMIKDNDEGVDVILVHHGLNTYTIAIK